MSIISSYLQAATLIVGNATANNIGVNSFDQSIVAKDFNPATGEMFVGLSASTPTSGSFAISKFSPYQNYAGSATRIPVFQAIATNDIIQGAPVDFLSLANSLGNKSPLLGMVPYSGSSGSLAQTSFFVQTSEALLGTPITGNLPIAQTAALFGTNINNPDANGGAIAGIAGLEGAVTKKQQKTYFFAPVYPSGTQGFGVAGSGIAVVNAIVNTPYASSFPSSQTMLVNQVAAQPGQTGIKASLLDPTFPTVRISGTGTPVITPNRVALYWDDQLQRLYTGLQLATNAAGVGEEEDGAASVVLGRLDIMEQGELTFQTFLSQAAIESLAPGDADNLVAARQAENEPLNLSAGAVKVMHTSTGPSYLIVWGGNGTITTNPNNAIGTAGNLLWALPVVDMQDTNNNIQGTLADKTAPLVNHRFVTQATNADGLTNSNDEFAQVGGGPLPQQPYTPISGVGSGASDPNGARDTLDIVVAGDTVYVAIATPQTDLDDAGVFYSQAMFDETGKIKRWTPWAKRTFPFDAFDNIPQNNGNVRYVSVDAASGNIMAVDGTIGRTALVTSWYSAQNSSELLQLLNQALCDGCYSVLDLDQSIAALSEPGPSRYALFGGINKVVFAKTTVSRNMQAPFNVTPPPALAPTQTNIPAAQKLVTYLNNNGTPLSQGCLCPGLPKSCCNHEFSGNCSCCNKRPVPANTPLTYCPQNFLITNLPSGAGAVKVLEYSKRAAGSVAQPNLTNYFFAGTNAGLFVYAQNGTDGFDARIVGTPNLGDLNKQPFSTGTWVQATAIKGSVIDIQTSGLTLYVTTVQLPYNAPILYSVFRINFQPTVADMFGNSANINLIAQTNTVPLAGTKAFYGIQIINLTNANGLPITEELILATNNGLYMSSKTGGVQSAISPTDAQWILVDGSDNTLYCGIGDMDTRLPTTAWPFTLGPLNYPQIYNRSSITQLNGGSSVDMGLDPAPYQFVPIDFNANDLIEPGEPFASFGPISYFWSDGARRFFIVNQDSCQGTANLLQVSPFDVDLYSINRPTLLGGSGIQYIRQFNWVKDIGGTGIVMAGTNRGVVALE
jgi:hypothetical protein